MFNLSGSEIIVILLLALVVLGPDKLPEAMRKAGRTFAEFKKMTQGFQDEVRKGFEEPATELRKTAETIKSAASVPGVTAKSALKNQPATYPDKPHHNPATDAAPDPPAGSSVAPAVDDVAPDEPLSEAAPDVPDDAVAPDEVAVDRAAEVAAEHVVTPPDESVDEPTPDTATVAADEVVEEEAVGPDLGA